MAGQYGGPLGGGGIPVPWGHKKKQQKDQKNAPSVTADGKTVSNDGKTLVIATKDGRQLTLKLNPQTKFTRSGTDITAATITPGSMVHIEAAEDEEAYLTATRVELVTDRSKEESPKAQTPDAPAVRDDRDVGVRPAAAEDPVDVPDRPILRRGIPKARDEAKATDEASTRPPSRANGPSPASQTSGTDFTIGADDPGPAEATKSVSQALISRTREWSETFTKGLPNFVCQQSTVRSMQESKSSGWQALDVVTAKVVYEDGKEDYREITVGGKRTNKSMLDLGGSTSTGEFASTLHSLFSPATRADFKFYRSATAGDSQAAIYDFKVALPNSDWFTKIGGQSLRPAYSGSVWIDRSTAQVRRIEMQGDNIPQDFPLDSLQWAVDYDNVRLGTATFLLPVHAENLYCQRGSTVCFKNEIDFRDYHKYSGESSITFDK
jgi:hypothetical protein